MEPENEQIQPPPLSSSKNLPSAHCKINLKLCKNMALKISTFGSSSYKALKEKLPLVFNPECKLESSRGDTFLDSLVGTVTLVFLLRPDSATAT